ncbi:MAG: hypothetical protein ACI9XK_001719 [Granulosicoccus sp.]|jgi:hypothetical protein
MHSNANARVSNELPHVLGVNATSGGLLKATLGAAIVASGILTFAWLPAEYGIDPTGVGHLLGLTEMGHIKESLHAEADADAAAAKVTQNDVSDINASEIALKLEAIQVQLTAISATVDAQAIAADKQELTQLAELPKLAGQAVVIESQVVITETPWRDEVNYTLAPGEGIEVKLVMDEGAVTDFEWSANGALLNHDTHGDGSEQNISYEKGRSVPGQTGQLTAAFSGNHGWFWRNRTNDPVVVTLRTRGAYTVMVLP